MGEGKKIIFAVDDAPANLRVIQAVLGDEYDLRLAKSGRTAKAALFRTVPDLILLDIEMPGVTGFDLLEVIRGNRNLEKVPVIFVTAHADKDAVLDAARMRAQGYIIKPFEPKALREKVRQALEDAAGEKTGGNG